MNDDALSTIRVRETEEGEASAPAPAAHQAPTEAEQAALAGFRLRETATLPISLIDVRDRLRPIDPAEVEKIVTSMSEVGQITPIEVVRLLSGRYQLVVGAHRLAAVTELGDDTIDAVIVDDCSDDQLRLREIDENLYRHELNPLDQAVFLAERQAVYLRLHPETKKGRNQHTGGSANSALPPPQSFAADVAKKIGLAKRTVQLALQRHSDLSPDALALIRGTWIARKGSALDQLRDVPRDQQVKVAKALLSEADDRPRTVRDARRMVLREQAPAPKDPVPSLFGSIERLAVEDRLRLVEMMANHGWCARARKAAA